MNLGSRGEIQVKDTPLRVTGIWRVIEAIVIMNEIMGREIID